MEKSSIHYSKNSSVEQKVDIGNILKVGECIHNGKYLSMPFCRTKSKREVFHGVIEKMNAKFLGGKLSSLSQVTGVF